MKFKVGDKVRITPDETFLEEERQYYSGKEGTIISIDYLPFPICVDVPTSDGILKNTFWNFSELELA